MTDEMTMLRDAGTELDPAGEAPAALRERVVAGFVPDGGAAGAPGVTSRAVVGDVIRMRRPVGRRLALVGGVAASLAAALVIAPSLGLGGSGEGEVPGLPISAAAAAVLQEAAAVEAEREPWTPRPDQFVYRKVVETLDVTAEPLEAGHVESWRSVDGQHAGLSKGWTDPDEDPVSSPLEPCAEGTEDWCVNVPAIPADIPTDGDPDVMLRYLRDTAGPPPEDVPEPLPDSATFVRAADLLAIGSLPPQARSALFEAVALIPEVTVTGDAVDAAGRPGVAVGLTYAGGDRDELIFDRETNEFLGGRQVRSPDELADRAGWALLESGVVDKVGQKP